jgi:hypothetical protein
MRVGWSVGAPRLLCCLVLLSWCFAASLRPFKRRQHQPQQRHSFFGVRGGGVGDLAATIAPPPSPYSKLHVIKRDGRREPVAFDKITKRLKSLCEGLDAQYVDPGLVAQKVVQGMYNGVSADPLTWHPVPS